MQHPFSCFAVLREQREPRGGRLSPQAGGWQVMRGGGGDPRGSPPAPQPCHPRTSQLMKKPCCTSAAGCTPAPSSGSRRARRGLPQRAPVPRRTHSWGGGSTLDIHPPGEEKPAKGLPKKTPSELAAASRAGWVCVWVPAAGCSVGGQHRAVFPPGPRSPGPAGRRDAPSGGASRRSPLGSTARWF